MKSFLRLPMPRMRLLADNLGLIVSITGLFLAGLVALFQVFGNINITGYWQAFDPREVVGLTVREVKSKATFRGCIHLRQKWPSGNVIGTIQRSLDPLPNLIGNIENDRLSFEFLVFEHKSDGAVVPEYGRGTLVLVEGSSLSGIWHQVDNIDGRPTEKGRWLLVPSDTTCEGAAVPTNRRPPFGKWRSLATWLGVVSE